MINEGKLQIGYGDPSIEQSKDNINHMAKQVIDK